MNWPVLFALIVALQGPVPDTPSTVPPVSPELFVGRSVTRLTLNLPEGIAAEEVRGIIQSKQGARFDMQTVDLDVRRLYHTLPVENVVVEAESTDGGVAVVYRLVPRVFVSDVSVRGNEHADEDEILALLDTKEGGELKPGAAARIRRRVLELYRRDGFFQADVVVRFDEKSGRTVHVIVEIDEGERARIGRVTLAGVAPDQTWVSSALGLIPGKPYSRRGLLDARKDLSEALVKQGYRAYRIEEPAVTWNPRENTVNVAWLIETGPVITMRFVGNLFFSERDLYYALDLDDLKQMPPGGAEEIERQLVGLYQRWGFIDVSVELESVVDENGDQQTFIFGIDEGRQRFIREVRFRGNQVLGDKPLYEAQRVRRRHWYSSIFAPSEGTFPQPMRLVNDELLLQTYQRSGFLGAEIKARELIELGDSLVLQYTLSEGARTLVSRLDFAGNVFFSDAQLEAVLDTPVGAPYDAVDFDAGVDRIRSLYRANGFIDVKVEDRTEFPDGVTSAVLKIDIDEGIQYRIGQIFVQGNTRTADEVIRRNLLVHTGDVVSPARLLDTQRKLYSLGIFGGVWVEILSRDAQARVANVIVRIQERANGNFDIGVGVGTAEGLSLAAELGHRNLWGTARSLRLLGEISYRFDRFDRFREANEYHADLGYREPWLFDSKWAGRANYVTELNRREATYNYTVDRIILGAERNFTENWGFQPESLALYPQFVWERDVFFRKDSDECGLLACQPNINLPEGQESATWYVSGLDAFLLADYRNDRFNPNNGWVTTYHVFYAQPAIGSDFHFLRQDFLAGRYWPIADRTWFSFALRGGYIALLPPSDFLIKPHKFVLGGVNSVRGYGLDRIFVEVGRADIPGGEDGGLVMVNYQAELRFPIWQNLGGILFHDAGQVWADVSSVSLPLLYTAGTGLRYDTPVGPVRLDIGWKLNPGDAPGADVSPYELHFAIGSPF